MSKSSAIADDLALFWTNQTFFCCFRNDLVNKIVIKGNTKEFIEQYGIEYCYSNGKQIHLKYCRNYFESMNNSSNISRSNSPCTSSNFNSSSNSSQSSPNNKKSNKNIETSIS